MDTPKATPDTLSYTPIADLQVKTEANILAVVVASPWPIGRNLWKTRLADTTGEINLSSRGAKFEFELSDVVAIKEVVVNQNDGRGKNWLSMKKTSKVLINPPDEGVAKLKEWHQTQVTERMNQRATEGFSPLAELSGKEKVHILAICARQPWLVGRAMWKTLLRDRSGHVIAMKRNFEFGFGLNDAIAGYSMFVGNFKGEPELEMRHFSEVVVNPSEGAELKEWYQNQVLQIEDQTVTPVADVKKNTTVNVLAICTSDPMERRPYIGADRSTCWQATLRDASGSINVMKDDSTFNFGLNDVIEARRVFVREFLLGIELVIDSDSKITVNPETEEATKLKEWYQTQGTRGGVTLNADTDMKLVEAAQHQLRSSFQIKCALCNVWCSGQVAYENHLNGKSHLNTVMAGGGLTAKQENGTSDGGPLPKKIKIEETDIKCAICNVSVVGDYNYETHMQGSRHLKKLEEAELALFAKTLPHIQVLIGNPPGKEYRCEACNAFLSSHKAVILSHINGAKHTRAITKFVAAPQPPPEPKTVAPKKDLIECKTCTVVCSSLAVLEEHRKTLAHNSRVLALQNKLTAAEQQATGQENAAAQSVKQTTEGTQAASESASGEPTSQQQAAIQN